MDKFILNFITTLHILLILFVLFTPFIGNNYFLLLHVIIIPFIIIHWIANNNACFLTLVETQLKYRISGKFPNPDDCISYRLVAPVYDFKKNNKKFQKFIYVSAISLWLISVGRMYYKYKNGKIKKFRDFIIQ